MGKWTGNMPTVLLNDRQIHPIEFSKWRDAQRQFARRDKDRETVEKYKQEIQTRGLREPILQGVSDRDMAVYVGDGHHRAVALIDLGVPKFRFRWYWIKSFGVRMEREPFPHHLLGQ